MPQMDGGFATHEPRSDRACMTLEVDEVAAFVTRHLAGCRRHEEAPLAAASGRVLAEDVVATMELPPFDQSAVDGYALRTADLKAIGFPLPVAGTIRAGDPFPPGGSGVARVLTGAPVPSGAAAIVMQEHVLRDGGTIRLADAVRPGANIRRRGEDVANGEAVVRAGTLLDARHLALFAALGCAAIPVRPRVRAAILALGDELVAPGSSRLPHQINDANSAMAAAVLRRHGAEIVEAERVPDCADTVREAIGRRIGEVDLIVTSGGMAAGDTDHARTAVEACGGRWFSMGIRMKPGKPAAFAEVSGTGVVGLPGNPFAALVAMIVVGLPVLGALAGSEQRLDVAPAVAAFDLDRQPGRAEFFPARRVPSDVGALAIDRLGKGGSARLRPLVDADGLGLIRADAGRVSVGDPVGYVAFRTIV